MSSGDWPHDDTSADFGHIDPVVPAAWSARVVAAFDVGAIACATVLSAYVLANVTSGLRAVAALVFYLVVPGWAVLRGFRARPCSLTFMAAIALSISFALIGGEVLVTRFGFPWRGATIAACGLSVMVLLVDVGAQRWH